MSGRCWILLLALVASVLVLIGSLSPGGTRMIPIRIPPVLGHFLVYSALGLLFTLWAGGGWRRALLIAGTLAVFGLLIELAQTQVPSRSFYWIDALANLTGAAAGCVGGWLVMAGLDRRRARC